PWLSSAGCIHNSQRRGLLATNVPAHCLCSIECSKHAVGNVAFRLRKSLCHCWPDFVVRHEIRLRGEITPDAECSVGVTALNARLRRLRPGDSTCRDDVAASSERSDISLCIDHRNLSYCTRRIAVEQRAQCIRSAPARTH